jgi:hypothetical protein
MAEADFDVVIRSAAKKLHKTLMDEAKARLAGLSGLAAKAKTKDAKARYRQTAREMSVLAQAAARRLQIAAENTADSYARGMNKALEDIKAAEAKPAKKAVKKKA